MGDIYICIDCGHYEESKKAGLGWKSCKKCKGIMKLREEILYFETRIEEIIMADK